MDSQTATNKYIIHQDGIEELNEYFYPFKEVSVIQTHETTPSAESKSEVYNIENELGDNIQRLKDEIKTLASNKQDLENLIASCKAEKIEQESKINELLKHRQEESEKILSQAQNQAQEIISSAQKQKETIEAETSTNRENFIKEAKKIGYQEGYKKGYQKGEKDRENIEIYLKKILSEAVNKKDEIVESIRQHLVDLVYTAVQKVVKKIAEEDRKVVMKNIIDALRRIDDPVKLIIKVSYEDIKASQVLKSQLLNSLKNLKNVEIMADPLIERGGCIVETDFTIVDARISTQLEKIGMALSSLDAVRSRPR